MSTALKIVHVDMNKYALNEMQKNILRIVPEAELHSFQSPKPALAYIKAHGCDVLLTEVEFLQDQFGGIELAKTIQELNPQVKIIFVTVWCEYEVEQELSELRVSSFLSKPWEPEKLAAALRECHCEPL